MTQTATPTKLRSGDWGAKVAGTVTEGETVTITTRSGKSWDAKVARVVWTNGEVAIVATQTLDRPARRGVSAASESCGYPCPVDGHLCTPRNPCHDCF